ncbi:hypothetical protein B0H16DRAFT_1477818 [Mycena metata]|uniref:Uncharacterized protein n=1 Tax=Mycena metata TaxID=1033252 RepID=A0AAD7H855_9AGAR|nr:hypothetical protein B0H16DRAFT_1477818 [Mycena metata]
MGKVAARNHKVLRLVKEGSGTIPAERTVGSKPSLSIWVPIAASVASEEKLILVSALPVEHLSHEEFGSTTKGAKIRTKEFQFIQPIPKSAASSGKMPQTFTAAAGKVSSADGCYTSFVFQMFRSQRALGSWIRKVRNAVGEEGNEKAHEQDKQPDTGPNHQRGEVVQFWLKLQLVDHKEWLQWLLRLNQNQKLAKYGVRGERDSAF